MLLLPNDLREAVFLSLSYLPGKKMQTSQSQTRSNSLSFGLNTLLLAGLLLFLLGLPFHLVIKKMIPGPVGTYWKEGLLVLLAAIWLLRSFLTHQRVLMRTRLETAVLIYAGLILLRLVLDRSGMTGWWGVYVSIMYLPLFWLVPAILEQYPNWLTRMLLLFACVGALVALGGLMEFIINKPLWPSSEILERQGFADVFIYGTHLRRVYFVFDSPTTLANFLALLLPLTLSLMLIAPHKGTQIAAGVMMVLITICIVLTFSRGIWVATLVGLFVFGLLSGVVQKHKRSLLIVLGALLVVGAAWGGAAIVRKGSSTLALNVVEAPSLAKQEAAITGSYDRLIEMQPASSAPVTTQTWKLYDPIEQRDDSRTVLYEHPVESGKTEIVYQVDVPENGALRFSIALSPEVWTPARGDGVSFQLFIASVDGSEEGKLAFVRYINPKSNPNDRRWRNFLVDLSHWAGKTVNISLITEAGPANDWTDDWAGWSDLQMVSVQPGYFASAQSENAVLGYTNSILDWVHDETNRDRLAAWNLSLNAWRTNPLWGQGLGSTGVAALRTHPESAFVTESQVLKALTELGIPGLLVWLYLWFQIGYTGFTAYRSQTDPKQRFLLLGILVGLLIVFIDGVVYQNLEVKQVNAFFWTLVGMLAYLVRRKDE